MTIETIYITAKSASQEDVHNAGAGWATCYDTLEDAKAYGLSDAHKVIVEITLIDNCIKSDDDIKVVYEII